MGSFSSIHLIAKELLDTPIIVETEIDKTGDIDITLYIDKDTRHKVMLSLDYPNWCSIREKVDAHFQNFDYDKDLKDEVRQEVEAEERGK